MRKKNHQISPPMSARATTAKPISKINFFFFGFAGPSGGRLGPPVTGGVRVLAGGIARGDNGFDRLTAGGVGGLGLVGGGGAGLVGIGGVGVITGRGGIAGDIGNAGGGVGRLTAGGGGGTGVVGRGGIEKDGGIAGRTGA